MEVMDSHMTEHFSAHPPSHADVDMSGEYYDEEYTMQDATEATNDEEIYDAEIDDTGHAEVEMDEYTDELADDEAYMGTYVPTDDATVTDVTVEDVQLHSSPAALATPRGVPLHPILPHAALDADLPINGAPADALATHSPHSVTTLVDDSEIVPLPGDGTKDDSLNEVIDLTETDDQPQTLSVNPIGLVEPEPEPEPEIPQNNPDLTEQELYESDDLPAITDSSTAYPNAPDQSAEEKEDGILPTNPDVYEDVADVPDQLEPPEQGNRGSHSPIEEALVINQQVRNDAADSMEPSPPVRLSYKDEAKGIDKIFDIFASSDSGSREVQLLFNDNRTLFYEPLSSFFMKLREIDYFSSEDWYSAEMGLKMDLGNFDLSISEDHKQTESVSLFKLSFIWSGLGLEGPLRLSLFRYSERFSIQLSRLVEQVEQRDLHNEGGEALHEVQQEESETGVDNTVDDDAHSSEVTAKDVVGHEGEENVEQGEETEAPTEPHAIDSSRGTEEINRPHHAHEDEGTPTPEVGQPETLDEQRPETNLDGNEEDTSRVGPGGGTEDLAEDRDNAPVQDNEPASESHLPPSVQNETEATASTDFRDNHENTATDQLSPKSPRDPTHISREIEYNEYDAEGANDLAPQEANPNGIPTQWGDNSENEYDYEEDYEDADGEAVEDPSLTASVVDEPARLDEVKSTSSVLDTGAPDSVQNSGLKRNIDELEYEEYETPSAPSSPASEHKRVKQA